MVVMESGTVYAFPCGIVSGELQGMGCGWMCEEGDER